MRLTALLLPLFAGATLALASMASHAGFYCMKMPVLDSSTLSDKDNQVPVRFRIVYEIKSGKHMHKGRVFASRGYALSADRRNKKDNYLIRKYNDSHACISMDAINAGLADFIRNANREDDGLGFPAGTTARVTKVVGLPRSHKANCPPARDISKNVAFKIHRRAGSTADRGLFDCGVFRKNEDSPYAAIPSRGALQGKDDVTEKFEQAGMFYQSDEQIKWDYILQGHDASPNPAHGGDASKWRAVDWGPALRVQLERYIRNCENPTYNLFCVS